MKITYVPLNDVNATFTFYNIQEVENFIEETHKEITKIDYANFLQYYTKQSEIHKNDNKHQYIYFTINGQNIYYSQFYIGIKDIITKINNTQKLITTDLITIIKCIHWEYDINNNNIAIISYKQQEDDTKNDCEIHVYKNMVICYSPKHRKPHIIKTQYNIRIKQS